MLSGIKSQCASKVCGAHYEVLLIEDDEGDAFLTLQMLRRNNPDLKLVRAHTADEAVEFLKAGIAKPGLILLDLNMPGMGGHEFLQHLRADAHFALTPVVVLTTSSAPGDVAKAYQYTANCYVQKPPNLAQFKQSLSAIIDFWFCVALRPPMQKSA